MEQVSHTEIATMALQQTKLVDYFDDTSSLDYDVTACALLIREQLDERSLMMRTLQSIPIVGKVLSVSFESSSQRYVLEFIAVNSNKTEHIRSDRVDGERGKFIHEMFSNLQGKRVVIYKCNEPISGGNGKTVRVAPFVRELTR